MEFAYSEKVQKLQARLSAFMEQHVYPNEEVFHAQVAEGDRWQPTQIVEDLKKLARKDGLWNLFLPQSKVGAGLTNLEYAPLCEIMGRVHWAPEVFNCSAPDTGNMETLLKYGTPEQNREWCEPLLEGKIRSAFLMTEPGVASSDATNIQTRILREKNEYVINGVKWWSSGAGDPRCKIYIVMVCTDAKAEKHKRHSQILVPAGTKGVEILRGMKVYGDDDAPHGHMHIKFTNVRVPKENLILGVGRGFEVSQGRLGPGRIHHCMRAVGQSERALEALCRRSLSREAFGKPLAQLGANYDIIAESRMKIEMARLLCLKAAYMMDTASAREAAPWISQIKVVAPRIALEITDEAVQMHGAMGITQDTPLAHMWTHLRTLRLADGPDAVHRRQVARAELKRYTNQKT
jgi:acyl-CoA dehydrogenase